MTHPALADDSALDTFDAGPCICPPKADGSLHHERDTITHISDVGYDDIVAIARASTKNHVTTNARGEAQLISYQDPFLEQLAVLERMVVGWTYVNADGSPVPLNPRRLREAVAEPLAAKLDGVYKRARQPVPNASGGPSPAPSLVSTSPNRAARRKRTKVGARPSS